MNSATTEKFRTALTRVTKREGIDIEGIDWAGVSIDRTWGDRQGLVFFGCDDETNKRVARFFEKWISRHAPESSYNAQRSISFAGRYHFVRYSNKAQGWYKGDPKPDEPYTMSHGFILERVEEITGGYAVSTTYYPCAE